jgi:superfamily II DNA or RNA helicase
MVTLTEKLLKSAAGDHILRDGRGLLAAGKVSGAVRKDLDVVGLVREGERGYAAGLRIRKESDIENLCTCVMSRSRGAICHHSVAVALAVIAEEAATVALTNSAGKAGLSTSINPVEARFNELVEEVGEGPVLHRLWVILPSAPLERIRKGAIQLFFEVEVEGRRSPLQGIRTRMRVGSEDFRLLKAVVTESGGQVFPSVVVLDAAGIGRFVEVLAGQGRVWEGRTRQFRIESEGFRPRLEGSLDGDVVTLRCDWPSGCEVLRLGKGRWIFRDDQLRPVAPQLAPAYAIVLEQEVRMEGSAAEAFLAKEWRAFSAHFEVDSTLAQAIEARLVEVVDSSRGEVVAARVGCGDQQQEVGVEEGVRLHFEGSLNFLYAQVFRRNSGGERVVTRRTLGSDGELVDSVIGRLRGFGFSEPDAKGEMVMRGERDILMFFGGPYLSLQKEFVVSIGERFEHVTSEVERIEPHLAVTGSGEDWFDLSLNMLDATGRAYSPNELSRLILGGQSHTKDKAGRIAVFDSALVADFEELLHDSDPRQVQPGRFRISKRHAAAWAAFVDGTGARLDDAGGAVSWARALQGPERMERVEVEGAMQDILRPYQREGVDWLAFVTRNGLGGVLADEMGLGKTVQTLAFLGLERGPCLVVCPASLTYNWEREVRRFLPTRGVRILAGGKRFDGLLEGFEGGEILIMSYSVMRLDIDDLAGLGWACVVLDEAQAIKNPDSLVARAAFRLRSRSRLALTGTPVENSVRDLWSVFEFVMPGYLGKRQDFRERYEVPMSKDPSGPERERLRRRIRPFILRRTKRQVAMDLPPKIEQVVWCELGVAESSMYSALVTATRAEVGRAESLKNQGQARMIMLTALLRLRQACCDLRLLGEAGVRAFEGATEGGEQTTGAKVEALMSLVDSVCEGGNRVLVFSQFTRMLDLIQAELETRGISFCRLDGDTRNRSAEVDRFQEGGTPVFLLSLKAGGVGLNLTAADTVIHFDPWWNPAVEDQATDRAHRIGQRSTVTAYKLITRGTVEERILALQAKKRALIDAIVESEEPVMEGLTTDDLRDLLLG